MARLRILDPTATPPEVDADPGPALTGSAWPEAAFGIRYDLTWRSFDWVRDEWSLALREAGATVDSWCAGDRTGEAVIETQAALEAFVRPQDVVVVGLGN